MFHADVKVKICAEEPVFGPGVVALLQNVEKYGSVKEACLAMKMSYSKGWKIINRGEKILGFRLVERQHGGKSGGSCMVTEKGCDMMIRYLEMEKDIKSSAAKSFMKYFPELLQDNII